MDTKNVFTKTFGKKPAAPAVAPKVENLQKTTEKPATRSKNQAVAVTPEKPATVKKSVRSAAVMASPTPAVARQMSEHFNSENIVRAIHKEKEELQRITVDVPKDIYLKMKVHLAHENVSIRDFVVRLIDVYLIKNNIR